MSREDLPTISKMTTSGARIDLPTWQWMLDTFAASGVELFSMYGQTEAAGRIATTMFVVYPPGIASIVPGERLDERAKPMLDYLLMFEKSANLFPGFDVEIQGIYREISKDGVVRFYTYVVRE